VLKDMPTQKISGQKKFVTLCGRKFFADVKYFPKAEFKGRTIIFCTDTCLNAFKADPDIFYKSHRNKPYD